MNLRSHGSSSPAVLLGEEPAHAVRIEATAQLPTQFGTFLVHACRCGCSPTTPDEVQQLEHRGMRVSAREPHAVGACEHNRRYLETKAKRAGHLLDLSGTR